MILFEVRTVIGEDMWKVHRTFLTMGEAEEYRIKMLRHSAKGTKSYITAMEYPKDTGEEIREVWRSKELEV